MRTVFLTIALILVSFILEAQEKEVANRKGFVIGLSSGYELYKKDNFALDFQLQTTLGRTFLKGDGYRDAATIFIGVGFNWY
ncbi:hypothetical protein [Psychroserpens sp. S379A]|uniref:hypothetical protein n=1 Tax=Psychroserpens sp. S379A TaxID=3415137 RepID=UPI003C79FC90